MRRHNEDAARASFDCFLSERCCDSRQWDDGQEPPDFNLRVGLERFAVEVTTVMERVDVRPASLPRRAIRTSFERFTTELTTRANSQGILSGTYVVRGAPTDDFAHERERLADDILAYVSDTQAVSEASRRVVFKHRNCVWRIEKVRGDGQCVDGILFFHPKWEAEAEEDLRRAVASVLAKKSRKLQKVREPWILLLLDSHNYTDCESWQRVVASLPTHTDFHTIFLASAEGDSGHVLYSRAPTWFTP